MTVRREPVDDTQAALDYLEGCLVNAETALRFLRDAILDADEPRITRARRALSIAVDEAIRTGRALSRTGENASDAA